ncbi:WD40 repeat domain-containing protein, partial [Cyberlindnera jadinii NRRL Y-1542]
FNIPEGEDYEKYLRQPKYIKTFKRSGRTLPICKQLFLAQELLQSAEPSTDTRDETLTNKHAIWAMKFSSDGKYLASAGRDSTIKIWKVISSPLDRLDSPQYGDKTEYASVFQDSPYRSYIGHSDDILSLDWSKNNFLLTSSMDKTVKLWNVNEDYALRTFVHNDFVPSIKFHPTDDRFFISGCLDHKVRLWSILENEVSYEFDAKNLVTAVAFIPNGSMTIVGTFNGTVYFLDTQNLELKHSLDLNKKKGSESSKITGIESFVDGDDVKVLISSNDSRIRLISLRHKQLEFYFKGLSNNSSQIIATVSDSHKYLISGSENHWVYLWEI